MSLDSIELNDHAGAQGKALANLLKTGDYSDLVISCGKDEYRVHKAIVCPRSHFFKAACDGGFKEAHKGTIDLPDDDAVAVRMMIEYLYHHTYAPPGSKIQREIDLDAYISDTEYDDEKERSKMELYGAIFIGNKRVKKLAERPEDKRPTFAQENAALTSTPPVTPAPPPPQQPAAPTPSQGMFGPRPAPAQTPPFSFGNSAQSQNQPQSTPSPPPRPPKRPAAPIPPPNLCLHAKVYALGEKYGIQTLKALALQKFKDEVQFHLGRRDFLQAMREAYTSTVDEDRPLRDAVVRILKDNKFLLKRKPVQTIVQETKLGFDLLMQFATG
ncbi:amino acid transport gap1 [Fusarium beomiforme]|uniref:Amino acid transport gap1 n=1 Tax=Fusarium beomiforme TaxID=44412 RepID=A0A9P5APH3_9HYPO|nr:amino acid transport gap1 [Fusarium beomiforme]